MLECRVNAGAIQIQVKDYEGDGDAILLLHYGGGNMQIWLKALEHFLPKYRVVLCDLRGHGKSSRPETGNDIDTMAGDLLEVLNYLKIDRTHIIGSSLGAEVGLSVAANNPDRVLSLVCEGAFYSEYGPYGTWEGTEEEFNEYVKGTLETGQNTPEKTFPSKSAFMAESKRVYELYDWWNETTETAEMYDAYKLPDGTYSAGWRKYSKLDYQKSYFNSRFENYYKKLQCPVLITPGMNETSNARVKGIMYRLAELPENAEIIEIDGWIHPYGWLLDPSEMCSAILNFLKT